MTDRSKLSFLIFLFAASFTILLISPAFFNSQLPFYPLLKIGDITDLVTPLILLPLYFMLFQVSQNAPWTKKEVILFLIFAAFLAQGQGMHLSANAIGHLLENAKNTDSYKLTHFFDEVLSHYIWFVGTNGLTSILLLRQWHNPLKEVHKIYPEIVSGLLYGITYFITGIEAQTATFGIPFAILVVIFGIFYGRTKLKKQPILLFFFIAHLIALFLFAGWFSYWGGLPEFSEVGLI